jgi:hypothetical protein
MTFEVVVMQVVVMQVVVMHEAIRFKKIITIIIDFNANMDIREQQARDSYENNAHFQADLHISNAVNYFALGYTAKEAYDFLHKAICLRLFKTGQTKYMLFKVAAQNACIVQRVCMAFPPAVRALIAQYPFALASNMPVRLLIGDSASLIHSADYDHEKFRDEDHYRLFLEWLMQQIAHFESDCYGKRFIMSGQEKHAQKQYTAKAIAPEPRPGQSYREFGMQHSQISNDDLVRLYGAFSMA